MKSYFQIVSNELVVKGTKKYEVARIICDKAGAEVVGIAIAIEKVFQNGGNKLRKKGYDVYSQAMIEKFSDGKLYFKNRDC